MMLFLAQQSQSDRMSRSFMLHVQDYVSSLKSLTSPSRIVAFSTAVRFF